MKAGKRKTKRVERDCLRAMLDFEEFNPKNEKVVTLVQDAIIHTLLDNGYDVVSSDTNLNPKTVAHLRELAEAHGSWFGIDDNPMMTPVEECIKRDLQRPRSVGERVIRKMYHQYRDQFPDFRSEQPMPCDGPEACIVDLDGSLALITDRSPYDSQKCESDRLNVPLKKVVDALNAQGTKIILVSGRTEDARGATERWLSKHGVRYESLYMRASGDFRNDAVVKEEIYREFIEGNYSVIGVFDDRPRVIRCWRALGLFVFDIGDGTEF